MQMKVRISLLLDEDETTGSLPIKIGDADPVHIDHENVGHVVVSLPKHAKLTIPHGKLIEAEKEADAEKK